MTTTIPTKYIGADQVHHTEYLRSEDTPGEEEKPQETTAPEQPAEQ